MTALADPTRSRLLLALERNELTVNELRSILQLPQSTISRHLKMLSGEGWLEARAEGTSRHYRIATDSLDPASRKLWHLVRDEVMHTTAADQDARRTQAVLAERSTKSQQFFSTSAGQWDRMRLELDGEVDVALLFLVLHYAAEPARVIAEAVRVLRPGGRLLVLDMMPHDRQDLRQTMGHLWQGFDRAMLGGWMQSAGLDGFRYNPLPADPDAKGPTLFAASGKRVAAASRSSSRRKADAVPLMKTA